MIKSKSVFDKARQALHKDIVPLCRDEEIEAIKQFLKSKEKYILYVYGNSGLGKTFCVGKTIDKRKAVFYNGNNLLEVDHLERETKRYYS